MNFTEPLFYIFLCVVLISFWASPRYKLEIIIISSVLFLLSWGIIDLFVFLFVCLIGYYSSYLMQRHSRKEEKKKILWPTIGSIAGIWFAYKYLGMAEGDSLLIPIGLSYYSFQILGHLLEVYWGRESAKISFKKYLAFNSFFPQLAAGPIERSKKIIPQLSDLPKFNIKNFEGGLFLISVGLIKKLVIADRIYFYYQDFVADPSQYHGFQFIILLYLGFFLLYFDFSGYADIARGLGKLFGIEIVNNFNRPYLAINSTEFWARWHISLTSWIRDYLYFPSLITFRNITVSLCIVYSFFAFWHAQGIGLIYLGLWWGLIHLVGEKLRALNLTFPFPNIIKRFCFIFMMVLGGIFVFPAGIIESMYSFKNILVFSNNMSKYINNLDLIYIAIFSIIVFSIETYEKKILNSKYLSYYFLISLIIVIVFRFEESFVFFYLNM